MRIDTTERNIMEVRGTRHTLILHKVTASDFGNYSCVADNSIGKNRASIELSGKTAQSLHQRADFSKGQEIGTFFLVNFINMQGKSFDSSGWVTLGRVVLGRDGKQGISFFSAAPR